MSSLASAVEVAAETARALDDLDAALGAGTLDGTACDRADNAQIRLRHLYRALGDGVGALLAETGAASVPEIIQRANATDADLARELDRMLREMLERGRSRTATFGRLAKIIASERAFQERAFPLLVGPQLRAEA